MPEEAKEAKRKIVELIRVRGPSLPVQISKALGLNTIFAGAFLSELYGEKIIKISHMKVGGSPLYFIQGQENLLENFYQYLGGKEREAFLLLKEKRILKDKKQQPAIRVALRNLKDFAITFLKDNETFWRFYSVSEQNVRDRLEPVKKETEKEDVASQEKIEKKLEAEKVETLKIKEEKKKIEAVAEIKPEPEIKEAEKKIEKPKEAKEEVLEQKERKQTTEKGTLDVFDKNTAENPKARIRKKQSPEKFLEEVRASLKEKDIELVTLESYNKKEVIAKIRFNLAPEKIHLLIAYDKKRIEDKDLLKAYKKSLQYKLDYLLFFKGELPKKLKDSIDACKNLVSTDKILM